MNYIKRHVPTFVDIDIIDKGRSFNTLEELLDIPWVKSSKNYPNFYRFSLTKYNNLVAEYKNGKEWWVVGYLNEKIDGLPVWEYIQDE